MNKIRIKLMNLDDTTFRILRFFFKSNLSTQAKLCEENSKPDVFISDENLSLNNNYLEDLGKNNQYTLLLTSLNETNEPSNRILKIKKPIRIEAIKDAINLLHEKINKENPGTSTHIKKHTKEKILKNKPSKHLLLAVRDESETEIQNRYKAHKHVGSNDDIDPNNISDLKAVYLTQKKYLYFYLSEAVKKSKHTQAGILIVSKFGNIRYSNNCFYHNFSERKFKLMQASPLFEETKLHEVSIKKNDYTSMKTQQNATETIWSSAILASKGRIPSGTDLLKTVEMKFWPNFTRLMVFRYAIQINSAWSRHKLSLIETATQLKIPQRYVFTLYCAMNAINSAEINTSEEQSTIIGTFENKHKSIFSKILSHIFDKKSDKLTNKSKHA